MFYIHFYVHLYNEKKRQDHLISFVKGSERADSIRSFIH